MDNTGLATHNGENFDNPDPTNYPRHHKALYDASGVEWKGCVEARAEPYDTLQTPPSNGDPDTLFVPFFSPDMVDTMGDYSNDYIDDPDDRYWVSTGPRRWDGYWVYRNNYFLGRINVISTEMDAKRSFAGNGVPKQRLGTRL